MRWINDKCESIRSRISAGMSDNPLSLFWGVFDESLLTAHLALCLVSLLGVVASGWSLDAAPFDCNLFLKEILIFYVSNTWNYLFFE